jgi:microcompartment protein CcmL/EutN
MIYNAVGVIEIKSIAKGIEACDNALKSAGIHLVSAHPVCPGKYEIVFTGPLSDVQTAIDQIRTVYGSYIIDAVMMGRIDNSVVKALMGAQDGVQQGALGVIETFSAASAIKAADTAVKTAKVEILDLRVSRGMGGKGMVLITGEVSDVTAAVEAGSTYAKDQGLFTGSSVMAAPHSELWQYL